MRRTAIVAALLLAPALALAASHSGDQRTITSVTVTNASAQALGVSAGPRLFLSVDNESASANIACNFGGTAALNTAGSYTIPAGTTRTWGPVGADNPLSGKAVNCISSSASSPATIESWP